MTCTWLYTEAKSWQTVIGSVLGFCALIAGALFNSFLNRKRDDRLRREEVNAIAAALYGEIVPLRAAMAELARGIAARYEAHGVGRFRGEPFGAEFREAYPLPEARLFSALSEKVGKLPSSLLLPVVSFYSAYAETKEYLPLLEENEERGVSYGVLWVLKPAMQAVTEVSDALAEIELMVGIEPRTSEPESGKAKGTIAWEQEEEEMRAAQP